ncbi:hypothetical protein AYR66_18695 [Noviherbaspirillum denitrificans]|uniref:Oxygen sensor histidine kinase NreB n=2 Tax=Noviherbaspirillum denitrificans TaxID=1968433 RepID=A0A254TEZ0_9BURK|nr:hypothetical protein AYR66_18695 [Noviherbaspirillum denitrificans]
MERAMNMLFPACLAGSMIREEERRRIAREIHDEFGQQLLALRMDLLALKQRLRRVRHDALVEPVLHQLDTASASMRALVRGLRPAAVELGLRAAFEWQCRELEQRSGIAGTLEWGIGDRPLPDWHAIALYRILQESFINMRRHAGADQARVRVIIDGGCVVLSVSDNGRGFDPECLDRSCSSGLRAMRERAVELGGDFYVNSAPGRGTCVTVRLPLERPAPRCACPYCRPSPLSGACAASLD